MNSIENNSSRNYGIDMARIISILLVIILHLLGNGGIWTGAKVGSVQKEVGQIMEAAAYCAVDLFALISGYVGYDSKYKISRIIRYWFIVVFYTLLITIVFAIIQPDTITIGKYINALFPISTSQYWYFTSYFCLFMFIPLLNAGISSLNKKQCVTFLIFVGFFFSTLQVFFGDFFSAIGGNSSMWLIVLYIVGAIIKKYKLFVKAKSKNLVMIYIACLIFIYGWSYVFANINCFKNSNIYYVNLFFNRPLMFYDYVSLPVLIMSICILLLCLKVKISDKKGRLITKISKSAFSVYIIHVNPLIFERTKNVFCFVSKWNFIYLILFVLFGAIIIFFICYLIELIRLFLFKITKLDDLINKICIRVDSFSN